MRTSFVLSGLTAALVASTATAQWNQLSPPTVPTARTDAAMGYDTVGQQIVMFGGGAGFSYLNDTWVYDGRDWQQANPSSSPSGRAEVQIVFDPNRRIGYLYGGNIGGGPWGGPADDETWIWDGQNWTQLTPTTTPGGRARYGAAYDQARNVVVIYGGLPDLAFPIASGDTWEFDGANWTQASPLNSPGPREAAAMCYDSQNQRTVLFGGIDPQVGGFADTWTYDGTDWTRLSTNGTPTARSGAKMVYDSARNLCVLYGGRDVTTGTPYEDTWEFDGANWTQVASGTPADHASMAMAYDARRQNIVMFGGLDSFYSAYDETWEYGASSHPYGGGCGGPQGIPTITDAIGPIMGTTYRVDLGNLDPTATLAAMLFGFQTAAVDLTSIGMPGCMLLTTGDVAFGLSPGGGAASWALNVPSGAAFLGAKFYLQGVAQSTGANALNLTVTEATEAVVGY